MKTATAGPRAELSQTRILHAALDLIDRCGLAALNMRDLGVALDASTMGVYRHFRNKAKLLDAVVDHIVQDFAPPSIEGGWQDQAIAMALRVRGAMIAHPELADLIGRELRRSPTSLRVNTTIIERLGAAGVPTALLPDTFWALSSYTTGYALLEAQTYRRRGKGARRSTPRQRYRKLATLLEVVEGVSAEASHDAATVLARPLDEKQFLFGLECLIRGLETKFGTALCDCG
jgi:AcrR family transcriptional regulator